LLGGCGLALLLSLWPKADRSVPSSHSPKDAPDKSKIVERKNRPSFAQRTKPEEKQTAEEQVAARLTAFSKNRREVARRYAEKLGVAVPADLEKLFDVAEGGSWDEVDRLYKELQTKRSTLSGDEATDFEHFMPIAKEIWGAHEAAHSWPAQALLDYGRDVLGSLKANMVYVGGTDPGRFIPTFLNETSSGEKHIVLTQNALADGTYLEYVDFLYGDRLKTIGPQESQSAFNQYLEEIKKRYEHDKQFPNEPKQMRSGENYKNEDGRVQISGEVPVMAINEILLQKLQKKNPKLSFGLEESFSLPSTYTGAAPLGPIIELGSENSTTQLTPAIAANSLNYWRDKISQITSSPEFDAASDTGRAYAHMIMSQGNLFSSQNLSGEAEQAYRLAQQVAPKDEPAPTGKLYDFLMQNGRSAEAQNILTQFQQAYPDKADALQKLINPKK
ncbi:MAG: hypothetical protein M3Y82_04215, partial [Verrucomicrobiota bacterium]|nr:hypothetical protein [Verrucomicrobiota bacterium]